MIVRPLVAAVLLAAGGAVVAAPPPAKLALTGARIIPVVGDEIDGGTVLIEHGVITAIGGADLELPYDAMEVDVSGKVLFPGMINAHTWRGLDVPNENVPVAPFLDVADAIDPSQLFFEDSLRDGVTTIHVMQADNCVISGLSRVVRPIGLSVAEMTVMPEIGLKLVTSPRRGADRMEQMASLREAFRKLDDSIEALAERKFDEKRKEDGKTDLVGRDDAIAGGRELLVDSDYGDEMLNLVRLRRGDLAAWFSAGSATDIRPAIEVATEQGLLDRTVLVLGPEAHRAVDELKAAGRPVVLSSSLYHRQRDPVSGRLNETFVPKVIHDAGLTFALQPADSGSMAERYLNYQAAVCVRNGVPRDVALKAITLHPAQMLGLGDSHGSIEVGKVANIVVLSGDPLDFSSWIDHVFIDGIHAYDRERDHRLQELLKLRPPPAAPETEDPAEATPIGDAPEDDADNGEDGDDGNGANG